MSFDNITEADPICEKGDATDFKTFRPYLSRPKLLMPAGHTLLGQIGAISKS